jgi:uncharacterized membrane protein
MSHLPNKKNTPNQLPAKGQTFMQTHYQGAIPPPEMMQHYAEIDPNLPNRIITMAEKNGESRRENEKAIIKKSFQLDTIGQISGLISVALVIWLCYQMVIAGHSEDAKWLGGSVIVALAVVFVTRKAPLSKSNQQTHNGNSKLG